MSNIDVAYIMKCLIAVESYDTQVKNSKWTDRALFGIGIIGNNISDLEVGANFSFEQSIFESRIKRLLGEVALML